MSDARAVGERITYLIANHNRGPFLVDCLTSLRAQTNKNWLALIADDASTDGSLDAIAPFLDERIRLIVNARNLGYIATLKRLIAEATTDIVAILDADDAISADATRRLLAAYGADPRTEFVYSQFAVYDAALESRSAVHGSAIRDGGTAMLEGVVGAIRSFRRSAYLRTTGLDDTMLYAEDRDLVYKLEELTRPVFVDAVLYHYRDLPDSQSHDPQKRAIGARNTWRARRAAFRRRNVSGMARVGHELHAWADYVAYTQPRTAVLRFMATQLAAAGRTLCLRYNVPPRHG